MKRNTLVSSEKPFEFTKENLQHLQKVISCYPQGRQASAVLPSLKLAQHQNGGWLSKEAIEAVATLLDMPTIRVFEVATFYTMFHLNPVGKHVIQVCRSTPCWLRGSEEVLTAAQQCLGIDVGDTTPEGLFTLLEVECLGACANAPVVQINKDYFEDLSEQSFCKILEDLKTGKPVSSGPQIARLNSAPLSRELDE